MKSYMRDYKGEYRPSNVSRQIYKAFFLGGGIGVFVAGTLLSVATVWYAGLALALAGIGISAYAVIYYRPIRKG